MAGVFLNPVARGSAWESIYNREGAPLKLRLGGRVVLL